MPLIRLLPRVKQGFSTASRCKQKAYSLHLTSTSANCLTARFSPQRVLKAFIAPIAILATLGALALPTPAWAIKPLEKTALSTHRAEEGTLIQPQGNHLIMECTKGEYLAVDASNTVRRWSISNSIDQTWEFQTVPRTNSCEIRSGKDRNRFLNVSVGGDVTTQPSGTDTAARRFEIYELSDAAAAKYVPPFYFVQAITNVGKPRNFKFVRIKEFTRNERLAIGSTGTAVRWKQLDENAQVFILWKFAPTPVGKSKDMQYAYTANASNPKFPFVWNPNNLGKAQTSGETVIYSFVDGLPVLKYTSSLPPRDSDGCSVRDRSPDPATQAHSEIFRDACFGHDLNYSAPWTNIGWGKLGQLLSDITLRKDMERIINGSTMNEPRRIFARSAAEAWLAGLQLSFGKEAYDNGQSSNKSQGYTFGTPVKGGALMFQNDGVFIMAVDVTYTDAIGRQIKYTDSRVKGLSLIVPLSIGAKNISVTCTAVGGKQILKKDYATPPAEAWVISGSTAFNPSSKSLPL